MSTGGKKRIRSTRVAPLELPPSRFERAIMALQRVDVLLRLMMCFATATAIWGISSAWAPAFTFRAGYVPARHPVETFAQALRAIGEPIHGRTADEISMADLLGQLFAYTEVFDMETRPELLNLQKTMVVVEGVARGLDPALNLWTAAEPIAREWVEANTGAAGAMKEARAGAGELGRAIAALPGLLQQAERAAGVIAGMGQAGGLKLDDVSIARLAEANARRTRSGRIALWIAALALAVLATVAAAVFVLPG